MKRKIKLLPLLIVLVMALSLVLVACSEEKTSSKVEYKITMVVDGVESVYKTDGKNVKIADPVKEGYTFKGWFTDSECTTAFVISDYIADKNKKDIKIYAKFDINGVEITYTKVEKVDATCQKMGMNEHFLGSDGKYYVEENGVKSEVTKQSLQISKVALVKVEKVEAKVGVEGKKEHWKCPVCSKRYKTNEANEINIATAEYLKIPALDSTKTATTFAFKSEVLSGDVVTKVFDNKPFDLTNKYVTNSSGKVTFEYYVDGYKLSSVPSTVSRPYNTDFKVKVKIAETTTHTAFEKDFDYNVSKRKLTGNVSVSVTYKQSDIFTATNTSNIYRVTIAKTDVANLLVDNVEVMLSLPLKHNAGSYTISGDDIFVSSFNEYYDCTNLAINLTINKATATFKFNEGELVKTYDGNNHKHDANSYKTNSDGVVSIKYKYGEVGSLQSTYQNAGDSWKIVVSIPATTNYNEFSQTFDLTVKPIVLNSATIERSVKLHENGIFEIRDGEVKEYCYSIKISKSEVNIIEDEIDIKLVVNEDKVGVFNVSKYYATSCYDFSNVTFKLTIKEMDKVRFRVEDVFAISGKGTVITSTIDKGAIVKNGVYKLYLQSGEVMVKVVSIEANKEIVEQANNSTGPIGLLIKKADDNSDVDRNSIARGDILVEEACNIAPSTSIKVTMQIYKKVKTGETTFVDGKPVFNNASINCYITKDFAGKIVLPANVDLIIPGSMQENVTINFNDNKRVFVEIGDEYVIRNGGREIGKITVTGI